MSTWRQRAMTGVVQIQRINWERQQQQNNIKLYKILSLMLTNYLQQITEKTLDKNIYKTNRQVWWSNKQTYIQIDKHGDKYV